MFSWQNVEWQSLAGRGPLFMHTLFTNLLSARPQEQIATVFGRLATSKVALHSFVDGCFPLVPFPFAT